MLMENIDVVSSVNILILSRLEDAKFSIKPFFRSQIRGNKKEEIACRKDSPVSTRNAYGNNYGGMSSSFSMFSSA